MTRGDADDVTNDPMDDPTDAIRDVLAPDSEREARLGFPEVVYGQHKSVAQLTTILEFHLRQRKNMLVTRLQAEKALPLEAAAPDARYHPEARTFSLAFEAPERVGGTVGVLCAGTSDLPVIAEVEETLTFLGVSSRRFADIGVAGIERLFTALPQIRTCDVLICAAGFEGALPSVLGGLVPQPLIAVPTSVGYGVAEGGHAALHAMLASCANGVTVVNIDNGYGAALAAFRMLKRMNLP